MSTSDTRAQSLISDLRQDELARGILNRVDAGRFVRHIIRILVTGLHIPDRALQEEVFK